MRPFAYTTSRDSPWSPFWMSTTTQAGGLGSLSVIHTMPRAARPEIPAPGTAKRYAICHTPMLGTLLRPAGLQFHVY